MFPLMVVMSDLTTIDDTCQPEDLLTTPRGLPVHFIDYIKQFTNCTTGVVQTEILTSNRYL